MIKKIKEGRSIIMSTQHIEEADELAEHVCVMANGKIVVMDTPKQIKYRYGVGYTLIAEQLDNTFTKQSFTDNLNTIVLNSNTKATRCLKRREDIEEIEKSSRLNYTIPFESSDHIGSLLEKLEEKFGSSSLFAIEVATLESAYIRIVEQFEDEE